MVNFGPLAAEIGSVVLGTPANFNGSQPNFARCQSVSWAGTLHIHFRGLLPHNGILPGAKFTLRPSLALSYIGSVTARHSSSGRQTNIVALSRVRNLYLAGRPSRWALAHILVTILGEHSVDYHFHFIWFWSFLTKVISFQNLLTQLLQQVKITLRGLRNFK